MTSSEALPNDLRVKSEDVRLACAFIPDPDKRGAVLALYALLETLREIPERVTEPLMGEIRLRWWFEAFEAISQQKTPHYHPLTEQFLHLIPQYQLPCQAFMDMVEGQMPLLDPGPLAIRTALRVVDSGEGIIARLAAQILGQTADLTAPARLYGMARLKLNPGLIDAGVTELAHLERDARQAVKALPAELMPVALPAALARNIWQGRDLGPLAKRLKLFWSFVTGRL